MGLITGSKWPETKDFLLKLVSLFVTLFPCAEDQRGRCVVTYPHHQGAARQEVQDPVAEGSV